MPPTDIKACSSEVMTCTALCAIGVFGVMAVPPVRASGSVPAGAGGVANIATMVT